MNANVGDLTGEGGYTLICSPSNSKSSVCSCRLTSTVVVSQSLASWSQDLLDYTDYGCIITFLACLTENKAEPFTQTKIVYDYNVRTVRKKKEHTVALRPKKCSLISLSYLGARCNALECRSYIVAHFPCNNLTYYVIVVTTQVWALRSFGPKALTNINVRSEVSPLDKSLNR